MNDEQKYLFDLKGYIVCKNVVPIEIIDSTRKLVDQLLEMDPKDLTSPVRQFNEIEKLKRFVEYETKNVNKNNDNIYFKYDEKLKKIKDVCA